MTRDYTKTLRIRKVNKVAPDERGQSVWLGKIDTVELELVSTTALERILKSEGDKTRTEIRKLAAGRKDGVLARDTATGHFRILSDADLRKAEPITDKSRSAAEELSLVDTQILRKALNPDAKPGTPKPKTGKKDKFGGFNPYDNN
ncbi:MAG: hypothetical protein ACRETI_02375 [Steroidobacteraceae bacterium]